MSNTIWLVILCIPTLFALFWAHYRLRSHRTNTRVITGGVLLVIGLLFGWTMTRMYVPVDGLQRALIFISSVGVVHVPAAFILQLKRWQRKDAG